MAKPKFSTFVSPVGVAKLAFLDKPSAAFQPGAKEYFKTRLVLDDTAENRAWITKVYEAGLAEGKEAGVKIKKQHNTFFTLPEDMDDDDFIPQEGRKNPKFDEECRGKIIVEAKSAYKPGLIDTAKQALPEDVKIYGGDLIRIKVGLNPYATGAVSGIGLYLNVVQLVEKKTSFSGGGGGVNTAGFDDIDGYVSEGAGDDEEDF